MAELDDAINEANAKFKKLDKSIESLSSQLLKLQAAVAKPVADNSIAALSNKAKSLQTTLGNLKPVGDKLASELSLAQEEVKKYEAAVTRQKLAMETGTSYAKQLQGKLLAEEQTKLANALKKQNTVAESYQSVLQTQIDQIKYKAALDALRTKMQEQQNAAMQFNRVGAAALRAKDTLNLFADNTPTGRFLILGELALRVADALKQLTNTIYKIQQNLGTNFATAQSAYIDALYNSAKSFVSGNGPFLDATEILDATKAFKTEFGTILDPAEATRIAGEAKQLGVSSDDYVKAKRAFLGTGGDEAGIRQRAIAQFQKAGLAGADAIKFAADNADLLAVAGDKYADSLFRAAADAKKIGINLGDIEKFANNIVGDFEGSLEKFGELSAMGIDLDFNQIAAVSATGSDQEILDTLKQQLQQSGIRGEELQTNRQLRLALTQATGMTESTLMKLSGQAAAPKELTTPEKQLTTEKSMLEQLTRIAYGVGFIASAIATYKGVQGVKGIAGTVKGIFGGGGVLGGAAATPAIPTVPPGGGAGLTSVASGTSAFSGNNILKGAAAMLVVAASVYVLAKGLQEFSTVNWADMGKAAVSIGVLALAAFGLSNIALPIGMGALAIAALGASMIPFAFALNLAAPALGTLSSFIGVMSQLNAGQVGILALMGPALGSMAVGLTALGMAAVVAAPGLAILGGLGFGLQKLGVLPTAPVAGTPITGPAPAGAAGAAANTPSTRLDTSKMEAKLDQVVTAIKGMKVEMDGHTVGRVSLNASSPLGRLAVVG